MLQSAFLWDLSTLVMKMSLILVSKKSHYLSLYTFTAVKFEFHFKKGVFQVFFFILKTLQMLRMFHIDICLGSDKDKIFPHNQMEEYIILY